MKNIYNFLSSQKGATAVEYGLIAAGIALTLLATLFAFGDDLEALVEWMIDIIPV